MLLPRRSASSVRGCVWLDVVRKDRGLGKIDDAASVNLAARWCKCFIVSGREPSLTPAFAVICGLVTLVPDLAVVLFTLRRIIPVSWIGEPLRPFFVP